MDETLRLLLLGCPESGKSTFFKQMRIIHLDGISPAEINVFRTIIYANVLLGIRTITSAASKLNFSLLPENIEKATSLLTAITPSPQTQFQLDKKTAKNIQSLWEDPAIKKAFEQAHRYHLPDSTEYFLEKIEELVEEEEFIPSMEDVLRCRSKTNGLSEISFRKDGIVYKLVDVGGQRSDKTKWIKCFEDISGILYFFSLSEYNMSLFEDPSVNRMRKSIRLFTEIANSKWFNDAPIILFLNKRDIFKEKIEKNIHPLSNTFPEYKGEERNYEEALEFIKKIVLKDVSEEKRVFSHTICCIDTENIREVFEWMREFLLQEAIQDSGFL